MVVQHNMQAMNANRMLNVTTGNQAKSTEKLSSGYKINRAADDAAGLTISEKMRKQMKGLDRASTNAEDGVSAVQTAEGALTEVHSMLQRMNELAVQAANGTNNESDRDAIQAEIEQLTTEIDRVAETTKFNETYLLKGNPDGTSSDMTVAAHDAGLAGKLTSNGAGTSTFVLDSPLKKGDKVTIAGKEYQIESGAGLKDPSELNTSTDGYAEKTDTKFSSDTLKAGDSVTYNGNTYTLTDKVAVDDILDALKATGAKFKVGEVEVTVASSGVTADQVLDGTGVTSKAASVTATEAEKLIKHAMENDLQVVTTSVIPTQVKSGGAAAAAGAAITTSHTVVASLEEGEVSSLLVADNAVQTIAKAGAINDGLLASTDASTVALDAGDSVTLGGVTTVATSAKPEAAADTYKAIDALANGGKVKIGEGTDQKTYTIVDEADVDEELGKLTKEMILNKIHDGDTVDSGAGAKTVIGDIGLPDTDADVISVKQAYEKMREELEKASSIGTEEGKSATVTNDGDGKFTITQGSIEVKNALSFSLHVGADADMTNKISVDVEAMSAASLGIKGLNVTDNSGTAATYAIDSIADAIQKVSEQRSALGAVQNRLEHTIANLDNVVENTTAAESRIRDTDMAEEMVEYSKNNILAQAGQSMLAQANQANQGVLSLLG